MLYHFVVNIVNMHANTHLPEMKKTEPNQFVFHSIYFTQLCQCSAKIIKNTAKKKTLPTTTIDQNYTRKLWNAPNRKEKQKEEKKKTKIELKDKEKCSVVPTIKYQEYPIYPIFGKTIFYGKTNPIFPILIHICHSLPFRFIWRFKYVNFAFLFGQMFRLRCFGFRCSSNDMERDSEQNE